MFLTVSVVCFPKGRLMKELLFPRNQSRTVPFYNQSIYGT